jgi:hypothetical protein
MYATVSVSFDCRIDVSSVLPHLGRFMFGMVICLESLGRRLLGIWPSIECLVRRYHHSEVVRILHWALRLQKLKNVHIVVYFYNEGTNCMQRLPTCALLRNLLDLPPPFSFFLCFFLFF